MAAVVVSREKSFVSSAAPYRALNHQRQSDIPLQTKEIIQRNVPMVKEHEATLARAKCLRLHGQSIKAPRFLAYNS